MFSFRIHKKRHQKFSFHQGYYNLTFPPLNYDVIIVTSRSSEINQYFLSSRYVLITLPHGLNTKVIIWVHFFNQNSLENNIYFENYMEKNNREWWTKAMTLLTWISGKKKRNKRKRNRKKANKKATPQQQIT